MHTLTACSMAAHVQRDGAPIFWVNQLMYQLSWHKHYTMESSISSSHRTVMSCKLNMEDDTWGLIRSASHMHRELQRFWINHQLDLLVGRSIPLTAFAARQESKVGFTLHGWGWKVLYIPISFKNGVQFISYAVNAPQAFLAVLLMM